MSENNQPVKVDITSSFNASGTQEAKREINSLTTEVNKTGQAAQEVAGQAQGMRIAVMGVAGAAVLAGTAIAAYTAYQIKLATAYAETAEQMAKLSERTGISIKDLATLNAVALTNDTTVEKLAMGLKNLSVKQLEANSGNQQAISIFKALGVEYEDGSGKLRRSSDVMDDVATKLAAMENGSGKNAIAAKLLGRGLGEELIPYLNQGADGLKRAREEADKLGIKIDEDTARAVKELKDNMTLLRLSSEAAAGSIAGPLVKALNEAVAAMLRAKKEGAGLYGMFKAGVGSLVMNTDQDNLNRLLEMKKGSLEAITGAQKRLDGGALSLPQQAKQRAIIANASRNVNELQPDIEALAKQLSDAAPRPVPKIAAPDFLERPESERRSIADPYAAAKNMIIGLENQLASLKGEGSELDKVLRQITEGTKKWTPELEASAKKLAEQIDLERKRAVDKRVSDDNIRSEVARIDEMMRNEARIAADRVAGNKQSGEWRNTLSDQADSINARLTYDPAKVAAVEFDAQKRMWQQRIVALNADSDERKLLEENYAEWVVARYAQITEELKPEWQKQVEAYGDSRRLMRDFEERFIGGGLRAGEDAFVKWATTGKLSIDTVKGALVTLGEEIARTLYRKNIAGPLAEGLSGPTGWLSKMLGFGTGTSEPAAAVGYYGNAHGGYGPGDAWFATRALPAALFNGAPRYHSGIGPHERAAVIRRDESVLTPGQMRALAPVGGTQSLRVEIVNEGAPKEVQSATPRIDVEGMVVRVFMADVSRNGTMTQGIASTFNLRRG